MSVKKSRPAEIVRILRDTETVRTGNTATGMRVWTTVLARITDDGPDHGRLVSIKLDPEQALIYAQQIIDTAGEAQRMRDDVGHTP